MKKKIVATLLLLFIPILIISCSDKTANKSNTSSNISNNENILTEDNKDKDINSSTDEITTKDNNNKQNNSSTDEIITEDAKIYYYNILNDKIVYVNRVMEIKNKAVATALVNELKKAPSDEIAASISKDILLKSAKVDREKDTITLDFSSNFVTAQNLGSGAESGTLKAICDTFGDYFNVSNVVITLEGEPYTSGHILMKDGESFKVDLSNTIELNK